MLFNVENLQKEKKLILESEKVPIKKDEDKVVSTMLDKGYKWLGFKIPESKKVFYMGVNLTRDTVDMYFFNNEGADVDIEIFRYK